MQRKRFLLFILSLALFASPLLADKDETIKEIQEYEPDYKPHPNDNVDEKLDCVKKQHNDLEFKIRAINSSYAIETKELKKLANVFDQLIRTRNEDAIKILDSSHFFIGMKDDEVSKTARELERKRDAALDRIKQLEANYDSAEQSIIQLEAHASTLESKANAAKTIIKALEQSYNYTGKLLSDLEAHANELKKQNPTMATIYKLDPYYNFTGKAEDALEKDCNQLVDKAKIAIVKIHDHEVDYDCTDKTLVDMEQYASTFDKTSGSSGSFNLTENGLASLSFDKIEDRDSNITALFKPFPSEIIAANPNTTATCFRIFGIDNTNFQGTVYQAEKLNASHPGHFNIYSYAVAEPHWADLRDILQAHYRGETIDSPMIAEGCSDKLEKVYYFGDYRQFGEWVEAYMNSATLVSGSLLAIAPLAIAALLAL